MKIPKMQLRKMIREEKSRILQEQKRTVFDMLDDAIRFIGHLEMERGEYAATIADLQTVKKVLQAEVGSSGWRDYDKGQDSNLDWM